MEPKQHTINRRTFIKISSLTLAGVGLVPTLVGCRHSDLTFGLFSDCHYALQKEKGDQYFKQGGKKLIEAIETFNEEEVDFVIENGDFINYSVPLQKSRSKNQLKDIEDVFSHFDGPRYHVLGNSDLDALSKEDFQQLIENTDVDSEHTYYSFDKSGHRFIVLDSCFKRDRQPYAYGNYEWGDAVIPEDQLEWLESALSMSPFPVIVFVHHPLDGEGEGYLSNAFEVRQILEKSKRVAAVFQGHLHEGGYSEINGIHYITTKAMVNGQSKNSNSYYIVHLKLNGHILIKGYKRAEGYKLLSRVNFL